MFFLDELLAVKAPMGWEKVTTAEQRDMYSKRNHKRNNSGGKRSSLFSLRSTENLTGGHGTFNRRLSAQAALIGIDESNGSSNRSSTSFVSDPRFGNERPASRGSNKSKKLSRQNRKSEIIRPLNPVRSPGDTSSTPSPNFLAEQYQNDLSVRSDTGPVPFAKNQKRIISPPFNFYHLTHAQRSHLPDVHRLSHSELESGYRAVRDGQIPKRELHGIKAEDLASDGYATDVPRSSTPRHALPSTRQRKIPPLRPKRSDELLAEAAAEPHEAPIGLRHARSFEGFDYGQRDSPSDVPPVPSAPPRMPPPMRSSRRDWSQEPMVQSLIVTNSSSLEVHSPTRVGSSISPNSLWTRFSSNGFNSPLPDTYSSQSPPQLSSGFQRPPIQPYADDPLLTPAYGRELERVVEEPEDLRSQRASAVLSTDVPATDSTDSDSPVTATATAVQVLPPPPPVPQRSPSRRNTILPIQASPLPPTPPRAQITSSPRTPVDSSFQRRMPSSSSPVPGIVLHQSPPSKPSLSRMNSNASDTLGGPLHRRLSSRNPSGASSPSNDSRSRRPRRLHSKHPTSPFLESPDDSDEAWEDDIDFCYDHHMEAHCDLDWSNVSKLEMSSSDEEDVPELENSVPSVNSLQDENLRQRRPKGHARARHLPSSPDTSGGEEPIRRRKLRSSTSPRKMKSIDEFDGISLLPESESEQTPSTKSARTTGSADMPPTPRNLDFLFPSSRTSLMSKKASRTSSKFIDDHTSLDSPSILLPEDFRDEMTRDEAYNEIIASYNQESRRGTQDQKYYPFLDSPDAGSDNDSTYVRPRTSHGPENPTKLDWSRFGQGAGTLEESRDSQLLLPPLNPRHKRKSASMGAVTDFAALAMPERSVPQSRIEAFPEPAPQVQVQEEPDADASDLKVDTIVAELRAQLRNHRNSSSSTLPLESNDFSVPYPTKKIFSAPNTVAAPTPRSPGFPLHALPLTPSLLTPPLSAPPIPRSHSRSPSAPTTHFRSAARRPPTPPLHRKISSESHFSGRSSGYSSRPRSGSSSVYSKPADEPAGYDKEMDKTLPPVPPAPPVRPRSDKRRSSGSLGAVAARASFSLFPSVVPPSPGLPPGVNAGGGGIASIAQPRSPGRLRVVNAA